MKTNLHQFELKCKQGESQYNLDMSSVNVELK